MWIRIVGIATLVVLASLSSVASYLRLLMRRLTPVAARKVFPPVEGGALGADRERIGVSVSTLHGVLMAAFAVVLVGLLVAGHTELAQIEEVLGRTLEPGEYSTVTGLVLAHLGHVPLPGEKVETQGLTFEVLEANPRTILKVRVRVPPAAAAPAGTLAAS